MGYYRAGFTEIVGVDNRPQSHYPFTFIQADALEYIAEHGKEFDLIHASPPCQYYSRLRHLPWLKSKVYWQSIPPTRAVLDATGRPWVIENVEDAGYDMPNSIILCGGMVGLKIFRHRLFEASPNLLLQPLHQKHSGVIAPRRASMARRYAESPVGVIRHSLSRWQENGAQEGVGIGYAKGWRKAAQAMGIDWMQRREELTQAIPPSYTEFIGKQLIEAF